MKSLMLLMQNVLADCEDRCGTSTARDRETIARRVENEGLEFLTLTLPAFCSDFERSLARGQVLPTDFSGWKRRGNLPVFLGGFLELIFDRTSGVLLENFHALAIIDHEKLEAESAGLVLGGQDIADMYTTHSQEWLEVNYMNVTEAVACVRQITRLFSKIELPCSSERVDSAYAAFLECEKELTARYEDDPIHSNKPGFDQTHLWTDPLWQEWVFMPTRPAFAESRDRENNSLYPNTGQVIRSVGLLLYGNVYDTLNKALFEGFPKPKHGPGATADGLMGNQKFRQTEWTNRLEDHFPAGEYLLPNWRYL